MPRSPSLPQEDVKVILELVKRLGVKRLGEEKVFEELKGLIRYYYLGYLPVTCKVGVNV